MSYYHPSNSQSAV
ncbi:hypothetical protein ID866_10810 [Astraeus odoratus]|nr:hypothetical protein ID866_10810 [Astraeus odoratus]